MGRDKWKIAVSAVVPAGPLWVNGDQSHLQQAIENLVFNARDATFEMRNHLRDEAKRETDPAQRKQQVARSGVLEGRGVAPRDARTGIVAVLEVRDNGIGMTEEVRKNCLRTHFTTKRDNALYEGYSAGMGLGLSFVAVVSGASRRHDGDGIRAACGARPFESGSRSWPRDSEVRNTNPR